MRTPNSVKIHIVNDKNKLTEKLKLKLFSLKTPEKPSFTDKNSYTRTVSETSPYSKMSAYSQISKLKPEKSEPFLIPFLNLS